MSLHRCANNLYLFVPVSCATQKSELLEWVVSQCMHASRAQACHRDGNSGCTISKEDNRVEDSLN